MPRMQLFGVTNPGCTRRRARKINTFTKEAWCNNGGGDGILKNQHIYKETREKNQHIYKRKKKFILRLHWCNNGDGDGIFSKVKRLVAKWIGTRKEL